MRIYSNVLNDHDITAALRAINRQRPLRAVYDHTGWLTFHRHDRIGRPRLARNGWNILLGRIGSNRPYNTGQHGASCERGAASWDDWGQFLAVLYQRDPEMRVARRYDGFTQFHIATMNRYAEISGWGEHGNLHFDAYGQPKVELATDGACLRSWNDALATSMTPTPAARCPYEGEHDAMGVYA